MLMIRRPIDGMTTRQMTMLTAAALKYKIKNIYVYSTKAKYVISSHDASDCKISDGLLRHG